MDGAPTVRLDTAGAPNRDDLNSDAGVLVGTAAVQRLDLALHTRGTA